MAFEKPRAGSGSLFRRTVRCLLGWIVMVVRAVGLEPTRAKPNGFSYQLRLSPPRDMRVCGLDYPFTVTAIATVGAARLVSTPSPQGAWLGIAM